MTVQPQRYDFADDSHVELAPIVQFPVTEWDRLELWARRLTTKQIQELAARNAALSGI